MYDEIADGLARVRTLCLMGQNVQAGEEFQSVRARFERFEQAHEYPALVHAFTVTLRYVSEMEYSTPSD